MDEVVREIMVSPTDLTPVLESLEEVQQLLEQLHADISLVFLGLALLVGVVIGCTLGMVFMRMWRA